MESRLRMLTIACAVVFLAGVLAAFTVDGDDGEVASGGTTSSTTDTEDDEVATDDSTSTTKPGQGKDGDGSSTTAEAGSSTTAGPDSTTTTTAATTTTTAASTTIPERKPTTPGTYTYDVDGCCDQNDNEFSGTSKLTVEAVAADGTQRQIQEGPDGKTTTVYRFAPEGTYLVSMQVSSPQGSFTLTAEQPFLVIPKDIADGDQTSGRLTDGKDLVADVTFTAVSIGPSESTAKLHADISGKVTQGLFTADVKGTMDSDLRARTQDQLPIETTSTTEITKPSIAAGSTTVHSVLRQ